MFFHNFFFMRLILVWIYNYFFFYIFMEIQRYYLRKNICWYLINYNYLDFLEMKEAKKDYVWPSFYDKYYINIKFWKFKKWIWLIHTHARYLHESIGHLLILWRNFYIFLFLHILKLLYLIYLKFISLFEGGIIKIDQNIIFEHLVS